MAIDWALLGKALRAARDQRGLSQDAFAEELGLRQSDLSLLERGEKVRPGPEIMAKLRPQFGQLLGGTPARPVQPLSEKSSLTAPERAMEDATFRRAWKIVGRLWLTAKAAKFKPDHPATKRWKQVAGMLDLFEHVGETPEPDAGEPWPAAGHPLHR